MGGCDCRDHGNLADLELTDPVQQDGPLGTKFGSCLDGNIRHSGLSHLCVRLVLERNNRSGLDLVGTHGTGKERSPAESTGSQKSGSLGKIKRLATQSDQSFDENASMPPG